MISTKFGCVIGACLIAGGAGRLFAQTLPPATIQYQGRVSVAGVAHNGAGYFKFLLYAPDKRLWSNDDSHGGAEPLDGYEPAGSVSISVSAGLFSADLGSGAMPAITPGVFFDGTGNVRSEVSLRVWFSATGGGTFVKLSPDRKLSSVPFALVAGTVARGAITNDKLGSEAVTADKIKNGEVVAGKLGPGAVAAANLAAGAAVANIGLGGIAPGQLSAGAAAANLNAAGQSGVASGGVVMSATENPALAAAGYVRVGMSVLNDYWSPRTGGTLAPRYLHTAVWTGSEMIVWGGFDGTNYFGDGGRYHPATNTWTAMSTTGAPSPRKDHTAVWTGSEMIVWGGFNGSALNDGSRYHPGTDTWTAMSTTAAPAARRVHTAVWTGTEMIVWGGEYPIYHSDGGRYNPGTDTWTPVSPAGARSFHTAVWTGSEMIVWGGYNGSLLNDGGRYNPVGNSWTAVNTTGAPGGRYRHTAVWTGSEMIVWGGSGGSFFGDGGRYNPAGNSWTATQAAGAPAAPAARVVHTAVWTGSEMIVWGGSNAGALNDGGRYKPADNSWTAVTTTGAPAARGSHTAVWTGTEMIVWGGYDGSLSFNNTAIYTPAKNMFLYQRP